MKISIKTKILSITISGFLIVSLFSLYYIRSVYYQQLDNLSSYSLQKNKETFTNILASDKTKLLVALEFLLRDEKAKELFQNDNADSLYVYCAPLFEQLQSKFNITHWYFIKPDKSCFLRVHRNDWHGDIIERQTLLNTISTKKPTIGLELGSRAFAFRAVCPYYKDNQLIGYVEISEEIGHFSQLMQTHTGDDFVLMIDKKYLNKEKWNDARKQYSEMADWNEMENTVLVNRTTDIIDAKVLSESWKNIANEGGIIEQNYKFGSNLYILGNFPVYDAQNQKVGALVYAHDITNIYKQMFTKTIYNVLLFIVLILAIVASIILIINSSIIRPVEYAKKYISELAGGNLKSELTIHSNDEIGDMLQNLKSMTSNLVSTLFVIKNSINRINETSEKLYSNSSELNQSYAVQKNSIKEIADEIVEISQKIKQGDESAQQTGKYSKDAEIKLEQGKSAFIQTIEAMNNIAEKVSIISEIAFQTNIIALNAAVEAARAGQHGKGFAVVANEVKKLAEISSVSAASINQLSGSSIEVAEKSQKILDGIIEQMHKTANMINEILLSSVEQNTSINHITEAINSLYSLSQQILSFSGESSNIAKELNDQTREMLNVVSIFSFEKD